MAEPTLQVAYETGIEIRYFAEDKAEKVKRHYEIRMDPSKPALWPGQEYQIDWIEAVSVTTAQKVLQKEALISWAQRTGANGMIRLFNMGVLQPVMFQEQPVLGTFEKGTGLVVVGEDQAIELLKRHRLTTDSLKEEGGKRGQSCHDALEAWAKTGLFPNPATYPISEQGYVVALEHFLKESGAVPVRYEVVVGSLKHRYAGRFDLDIELPKSVELQTHWTPAGRGDKREWFEAGLYRIDLKTSKDVYEEHGEQLEAYEVAAVECGFPESLARVVLNCTDNSRYKFKPSWSTFEDFEATLTKWRLNEDRKKRKKEMA